MPSDESKGSQLDAIGSLAQRQLDNTLEVTQDRRGRREEPVLRPGFPGRIYSPDRSPKFPPRPKVT